MTSNVKWAHSLRISKIMASNSRTAGTLCSVREISRRQNAHHSSLGYAFGAGCLWRDSLGKPAKDLAHVHSRHAVLDHVLHGREASQFRLMPLFRYQRQPYHDYHYYKPVVLTVDRDRSNEKIIRFSARIDRDCSPMSASHSRTLVRSAEHVPLLGVKQTSLVSIGYPCLIDISPNPREGALCKVMGTLREDAQHDTKTCLLRRSQIIHGRRRDPSPSAALSLYPGGTQVLFRISSLGPCEPARDLQEAPILELLRPVGSVKRYPFRAILEFRAVVLHWISSPRGVTLEGPRCMKHPGPLCLRLGGDVWTSVAQFQDSFALGLALPSLEMISNCRRCSSAGCLATIDP